jgi:hypothetical protein
LVDALQRGDLGPVGGDCLLFSVAENAVMDHGFDSLYIEAELLQSMMVAIATGSSEKEPDYARLRQALVGDPSLDALLPRFVKSCRSIQQFWGYIKQQHEKYEGRRQHIYTAFQPLLDHLENPNKAPSDKLVSDVLEKFDAEHVGVAWKKALDRRTTDAEGAITSARTLLESMCKHILDEEGVAYDDKDDLPKLYRRTAEKLNIAPSQHTEEVFKQILGGCTAVVEGRHVAQQTQRCARQRKDRCKARASTCGAGSRLQTGGPRRVE